jgi:hypothetical protein
LLPTKEDEVLLSGLALDAVFTVAAAAALIAYSPGLKKLRPFDGFLAPIAPLPLPLLGPDPI